MDDVNGHFVPADLGEVVHDVFLAEIIDFLSHCVRTGEFRMYVWPERTAAVSTPVGPPPQTTKLRRRLRSSGEVVGRLADSKLSVCVRSIHEFSFAKRE